MATTYVVTGSDTGIPRLPNDNVIAGLNKGDKFSTTLDPAVEAELIGAGLIAKSPLTSPVLMLSDGTLEAEDGRAFSGGGGSGNVVVRKCPFAFDTPNLLTGAPLYTPTIGDVLLDAWIEIGTAWNGTTPKADVGRFLDGYHIGWWQLIGSRTIDLTQADATEQKLDYGMLGQLDGVTIASLLSLWYTLNATVTWPRAVPAKFVTADPVKVVVSRDGSNTGADPGASQGAAVLYLITATPV